MTDELAMQILTELRKLNESMTQVLCYQKVMYGKRPYPPVGPAAGSVVDGKGRLPDTPIPDYGANGLPADASVPGWSVHP